MLWLSKRLSECKSSTLVGNAGSSGQQLTAGGPLPGPRRVFQGPDSKPTRLFRTQLPLAAVSSACSKGDTPNKVLEMLFKKLITTRVHSSSIHDSQELRATQVFITYEWLNKMGRVHTVECFSVLKRKETLTHAYNMSEPRGCYAE